MTRKNDRNEEPVSRFWTKINLVNEIAAVLRKDPPVRTTFLRILEIIQSVIPFESSTLYLFNKKKKELEEIVTLGPKIDPIDFVQFDAGSGLNAWAAQQKKPILLSNLRNQDRPPEEAKSSLLIIPLLVEDKIIGTISYAHSQAAFFQEKDQKLLLVVGDQLAVSIERLLYQRELENKNQALLKIQKELKAVQKSRIDSEKLEAVRQLAVSINHEINNPLSVIVGNIQYLLFIEKNLDEKVAARLKKVEEESLKIAEINRRLLKIEDLVSETYIGNGNKIKMINLQKSTAGV
ncbi:hypothetical protein TRIP_C60518 [Candidatus Zixiibacteriota bacterium]|nr:hypothetical protein TRIP_C60518 [candidate division Zixibacteria bacterium]